MRIKKNDKVIIIAGRSKGLTGRVLAIDHQKKRVSVDIIKGKKHLKAKQDEKTGKIKEFNCFVDVSNVAVLDPKYKNKPTRITYKTEGRKKIRVAVRSKKAFPDIKS